MSSPLSLAIRRTRAALDVQACVNEGNKLQWHIATREPLVFDRAGLCTLYVGAAPTDPTPLSWVSTARYPSTTGVGEYAHVSLYLTVAGHRGQGLGGQLWAALVEGTRGCTHGLDSVPEGVPYYTGKGYTVAFQLPLYGCIAGEAAGRVGGGAPPGVTLAPLPTTDGGDFSPLPPPLLAELAAYDAGVTGVQRAPLLHAHLGTGVEVGVVARGADGGIVGWAAAVRDDEGGYEMAPLLADTPAIARGLAGWVVSHLPPTAHLGMWPPSTNEAAVALAVELGGVVVWGGLVRMHDGPVTAVQDVGRVFAILSPEFS